MLLSAKYLQEYREPAPLGPAAQYAPSVTPAFPANLTASGGATPAWQSDPILSGGMKALAVSVQTTRTGNLSVQRYLDAACTIPIGAPITATLAAATQNFVSSADAVPFAAFRVTISNTDVSNTSVISNFGVLMQAG